MEIEVAEVVLVVDEAEDAGNVAATMGMVRWMLTNCTFSKIFSCYLISDPQLIIFSSPILFFDGKTFISGVNAHFPVHTVHTVFYLFSMLASDIPL